MNDVSLQITFIAFIFVTGLALCIVQSLLVGISFLLVANMALPTIIKLAQHFHQQNADKVAKVPVRY